MASDSRHGGLRIGRRRWNLKMSDEGCRVGLSACKEQKESIFWIAKSEGRAKAAKNMGRKKIDRWRLHWEGIGIVVKGKPKNDARHKPCPE